MFSYFNYRSFSHRVEQQQPRVPMELAQPHPDTTVIRTTSHREHEYDDEDEYNENEPVPDLEKDDMMARRTGTFQKPSAARTNQSINQFLPVPGSVKYNIAPVSAMKPLDSRPKLTEKMANERYLLCLNGRFVSIFYLQRWRFNCVGKWYGPSTNINKCLWIILLTVSLFGSLPACLSGCSRFHLYYIYMSHI